MTVSLQARVNRSFGLIFSLLDFWYLNKTRKAVNLNAQVLSMEVAICSSLLIRERRETAEGVGCSTKELSPLPS